MADNPHQAPQDNIDDEDFVSKTAIKKAMQELQLLGEQLVELSHKKLALLPIGESILTEINLAKKIKSGNAKRRQLQRIGKLLRAENAEEIKAGLENFTLKDRRYHVDISLAESWCEQLITEETAIGRFLTEYPSCDRQHLLQLIRHTKKENKEQSNSGKYRQRLFKAVSSIVTHTISD